MGVFWSCLKCHLFSISFVEPDCSVQCLHSDTAVPVTVSTRSSMCWLGIKLKTGLVLGSVLVKLLQSSFVDDIR